MAVDDALILTILREIRADQASQRKLPLRTVEYMRRMGQHLDARISSLEARVIGMCDDLEIMLKAEIMGAMTQMETQPDHRIDELAERTARLEAAG